MSQRLLLTTDVVGGVWDFSLALARELHARASARVTILALGEPSSAQVEHTRASGAQLLVEPVKLEWMQDCADDVLRTRELIGRHVRNLRPDVLHANQFVAACAEVDVPVVLTLHSDVLSWRRWTLAAGGTPPEWYAYRALVREAVARADRVVAVSAFLAREVLELYDCNREIRVIHNGWPPPSEAANAPANATGRVGKHAPGTLVAGRAWDAAKNIALVAEAARGFDTGPVYLAGQQASPETGGRFDVPWPLQPLGFLPQAVLAEWMNACPVYLSAARYDPFGLLPVQAALNGCALLLSDIPSYRELWDGAATFFRSDDAADLRHRWQQLLEKPDRTQHLAALARQRAVERYTIGRMADAYSDVYAGLVSLPV